MENIMSKNTNPMETVIILWLTTFITMLGIGLIAPLMSIYAKSLGASNLEIGLIFGSFAIARTIAQMPVGSLSDKYGKKIFILIGTFFCGIFTLSYAFVVSVIGLIFVRVLNGVFSSFITPVAGAYVASIAPKERLGEYMGLFSSAIALGFATGPLIGGFLAEWYGLTTPFYFCGAITFFAFIISYFKLKNIIVNKNGEFQYTTKLLFNKSDNLQNYRQKLISFEFLKNKYFLASYVMNTTYMATTAGVVGYLAIYAYSFNIGLGQVGFLIASTNLVMGLLQRAFGKLYDKKGNILIIIGLIVASVGVWSLSESYSFLTMLGALMIMAVGNAIYTPAINALSMKEISAHKKGSAMGFFTTSLNIGMFIGAVVLGFVADYVGLSNMYKFAVVSSFIICFMAYISIIKEDNKRNSY
jgi:MFS family permease